VTSATESLARTGPQPLSLPGANGKLISAPVAQCQLCSVPVVVNTPASSQHLYKFDGRQPSSGHLCVRCLSTEPTSVSQTLLCCGQGDLSYGCDEQHDDTPRMGRVVSECPSTTLANRALPPKTLVGNEQLTTTRLRLEGRSELIPGAKQADICRLHGGPRKG
jgi:hypothetical protein